jgi:hypothetical protein
VGVVKVEGERAANKIRIDFHPLSSQGPFGVEKQDGGKKRRWLTGITSGIDTDGHGEHMTEKCIKSFVEQANSGDVLLFAGKHDVNFVDDIGRLAEFNVTPEMDWKTGYRLYDEDDHFDAASVTLQTVDKVWRQCNGIPPYTKPQPRGFSIEGDIPDGGIKYMDAMGRRVIDEVKLAGVVLVRSPAYRTSVAHAVMKALGLPTSQEIRRSLLGGLAEAVEDKAAERDYYDEYYQLTGALENMIHDIMAGGDLDKRDRLESIFDEYGRMMTDLVLRNTAVFAEDERVEPSGDAEPARLYAQKDDKTQALLSYALEVQAQLEELVSKYKRGGQDAEKQHDGPHGDPQ